MSERKRRDITLGEMQDECTKIGGICVGIKNITEDCKYLAVCPFQSAKRKMCALNLTDPTRFNEAQMALMKGLYQNGAATIRDNPCDSADVIGRNGNKMAEIDHSVFRLKRSETLDLAELLGKDGADEKT